MKKVMLINGSPLGTASASYAMARAFMEGYAAEGGAETRQVHLRDKRIGPCKGCYGCWKTSPGICVLKDDMEDILTDYAAADLLLFSTPVYHFGMTSLLKAFFERTLPLNYPYMVKREGLYHHPERRPGPDGRRYGLFSTCGFPDPENFLPLVVHAEKLLGPALAFKFLCPEGELFKVAALESSTKPRLALIREAGAHYARLGVLPPGVEAATAPLVPASTFAALANASWSAPGEAAPGPEEVEGQRPYLPGGIPTGDGAPDQASDPASGQAASPALSLLRQMAALYDPKAGEGLDARVEFAFTDLKERYQLHLSPLGCTVEGAEDPGRPDAGTKITVPFSTWQRIASGSLDGQEALMAGAYRIEGDLSLMMRFSTLFSPPGAEGREGEVGPARPRAPNLMALAFLPWYLGWFLGGSSVWLGEALPLVLSLGFLSWRENRNEATWFERGTALVFAFLTTLALASPDFFAQSWNALVNAGAAAVWGLSLLYGRPLTSDYSRVSYPASVANGPIFARINTILTGLWAAVFALEAGAGFLLRSLPQGRIAIAAAVLLIPVGIFTARFPAWYPGHLARRPGRSQAMR